MGVLKTKKQCNFFPPFYGRKTKTLATDVDAKRKNYEDDYTWDLISASRIDGVRGKRAGRLLQYDPKTEEVIVLARNLTFANGVSVDADETYLFFAETWIQRLSRYHLTGPLQGTVETVVESKALPGVVDGTDCDRSRLPNNNNGKCYAAMPTKPVLIYKLLQILPDPIDLIVRALLLLLVPDALAPKPPNYSAVLEVDVSTGSFHLIQDPNGIDWQLLSGVTHSTGLDGKKRLYLGFLEGSHIGILDLD